MSTGNLVLNVEKGRSSVHVDARPDDGVVWIDEAGAFSTGTVELDIKGKDALQQSFVGLAFHGTTDTSFEVIYAGHLIFVDGFPSGDRTPFNMWPARV